VPIYIYVDGLAEPTNPGIGTYGFVIYKDGKKVEEGRGFVGKRVTNNVSEYTALIEALKRVEMYKDKEITIYSDSMLLVNQMAGVWEAKGGMYIAKMIEAMKLADEFKNIRFVWIPREKNEEADNLSRIAWQEFAIQEAKRFL
jgi:ribonuclease HI